MRLIPELSVSLLYLREPRRLVRMFEVPLKSHKNINGLIDFLNIIFATGNTVGASLGGYLSDTIGWRWFVTTQLYIGVMSSLLLFQGLFITGTRYDPR